nr:low-density lipoprotein receptor-related protein 5-like isoform X3 [Crassostrea gigas]
MYLGLPFFERGFLVNNASMFAMHDVHSKNGQSNRYNYRQISGNIKTFAVDVKSRIIYFVDSGNSVLKKHNIISQKESTIATGSSAKDLNFDWIANLLGWIEEKGFSIMCFSVNSQTTNTIYSNLDNPSSLTVESHTGTIYWISGTQGRSIVRGSWTRDAPKVLISFGKLKDPRSLQHDVTSNRLYWLEHTIIRSSKTNGMDVKSHIDTKGATKSFAYKDFFGWINEDGLYFARKIADRAEYGFNTLKNSKDVDVFDFCLQNDRRGTCHVFNGGCEEICIPEKTGRKCECDIGLQIQPDQSCDSDVLTSNFIAVTDFTHGRILQIELQTGNVVKLPLTRIRPKGLAFDKTTMTLFYSDALTKTITSSTLHGKNKTLIYELGLTMVSNLAIDYSTGNLYYTAEGPTKYESYIGVVHRTTFAHKTLISNIFKPNDIALYPSKGYLFWTEFGDMTEIGRASMDGTSRFYFPTTEIRLPHYLAKDYKSDRLYWTDAFKNSIETSDLNGGHQYVLAYENGATLNDIVVYGQYLFYTAWQRQRITKMDKLTGSRVNFMSDHPEFGNLYSLDIDADEIQDGLGNAFVFSKSKLFNS